VNDIHDLLGAYCTDALDADDRAAFERHLPSCDECRAQAADFREVLAALAAAHPVHPPHALEDAVVARARTQGSDHRSAAGDEPPTPPAATVVPERDSPPAVPSPMARRWRRAAPWMAAAAAGALLFASGLGLGRSQVPAESTASGDAIAAVLAVASAEDAHVLPVDIMGTTSRVVVSQEMDKAVFLASDLPMPAKGMCYQVWRVSEDGTMQSAGVAVPAADGHIAVVLDGGAQDVTKFVITMEPPGGSERPSGDMLGEVRT
jgi:anti-sigma-K factor RskA